MLDKYCVVHGHVNTKDAFKGLRIITREEHSPYNEEVLTSSGTYDEAVKELENIIKIGLDEFMNQCLGPNCKYFEILEIINRRKQMFERYASEENNKYESYIKMFHKDFCALCEISHVSIKELEEFMRSNNYFPSYTTHDVFWNKSDFFKIAYEEEKLLKELNCNLEVSFLKDHSDIVFYLKGLGYFNFNMLLNIRRAIQYGVNPYISKIWKKADKQGTKYLEKLHGKITKQQKKEYRALYDVYNSNIKTAKKYFEKNNRKPPKEDYFNQMDFYIKHLKSIGLEPKVYVLKDVNTVSLKFKTGFFEVYDLYEIECLLTAELIGSIKRNNMPFFWKTMFYKKQKFINRLQSLNNFLAIIMGYLFGYFLSNLLIG